METTDLSITTEPSSAVVVGVCMSANSSSAPSSAYALVDKDVTQDSDLLTPEADLVSSHSPSKTYAIANDGGEEKKKPTLLGLPDEVKSYIWKYVVTCDVPIVPFQIAKKSNKFLWNEAQFETSLVRPLNVAAVPQLDITSLSQVCRMIYEETCLTHLFYEENEFDFSQYPQNFLTYMVAITKNRRDAIRSIVFKWDTTIYYESRRVRPLSLNVIASCKNLQFLKLYVSEDYFLDCKFTEPLGRAFVPDAVQGLKELGLKLPSRFSLPLSNAEDDKKTILVTAFQAFQARMARALATPRTGKHDLTLFREAEEDAGLDVDGDGRLSDDKKPGIVSSRTRSRRVMSKAINADGLLPAREAPKYSVDGEIAWYIIQVLDSRESICDDGTLGCQLKLECQAPGDRFKQSDIRIETFWDEAMAVGPADRYKIVDFFEKNREKPGLLAIGNEWSREPYIEVRWQRNPSISLAALVTRIAAEKQAAVIAEEMAAKAAAKAAKAEEKAAAKAAKAEEKAAAKAAKAAKAATKTPRKYTRKSTAKGPRVAPRPKVPKGVSSA